MGDTPSNEPLRMIEGTCVFVFFSKMSSECSFDIHKLLAIGSCEIYFIVSFYLTVQVIFLAKTNFFEALLVQCFLMLSGIFKNILLFFKSWNLLMILQLRFNYCGFSQNFPKI